LRLRELLQLIGLGKGIRFYPTELTKIKINSTKSWLYPVWKTPKPPKIPDLLSEIAIYRQLLDEGDWAIDIGAHLGDSTVPLAVICGLQGGVLAFEPNPATFHLLSINSCVNQGVGNIIPIPLAATEYGSTPLDCEFKKEIFEYGDHWLGNGGDHSEISKWLHGSAYNVPVMSVSARTFINHYYPEIESKLKFIKIDCEGRDLRLLPDLVTTYSKQQCSFQWEMINNQQSWDKVVHIFKNSSYTFWIRPAFCEFELSAHKSLGDRVIDVMAVSTSRSIQNMAPWTQKENHG
jgi:FkbM family methyltransferase